MHRKSIEAAEQLKCDSHSPCGENTNDSCCSHNSNFNSNSNQSGSGCEEDNPHHSNNNNQGHHLNNKKPDFSSLHFPNSANTNNNLIRRHSSVASLRAKAQQHMSSLGIPLHSHLEEEGLKIDHNNHRIGIFKGECGPVDEPHIDIDDIDTDIENEERSSSSTKPL